jgi:hypothetical protein
MPNIDLSWCSPNEYPNILARSKSVANKRGSVDRINLVLESESENAIIDFRFVHETQTLEVILRSVGHWMIWSVPIRDVPSDPVASYGGFVRQAGEMGEDLIAGVHKRFFLDEWAMSVGTSVPRLFSGSGKPR